VPHDAQPRGLRDLRSEGVIPCGKREGIAVDAPAPMGVQPDECRILAALEKKGRVFDGFCHDPSCSAADAHGTGSADRGQAQRRA